MYFHFHSVFPSSPFPRTCLKKYFRKLPQIVAHILQKAFSTTLYHNPDNLFIRFAHTFLRQLSHVPDGIFHTVGNDSITAVELLSCMYIS